MNKERLLKIIEDMTEVIANLKEYKAVLKRDSKDERTIFIEFRLYKRNLVAKINASKFLFVFRIIF